jgi:hypothetical protein
MPESGGEILLYQTEDGRTRIECRFENETLWLTQGQMAELFRTTPQNVTLHLKAIYAEGEQSEEATCKSYLQVRQEGRRAIQRQDASRRKSPTGLRWSNTSSFIPAASLPGCRQMSALSKRQ